MSEKKDVFTRADLIEAVAQRSGTTRGLADQAVRSVLDAIVKATQRGDKVMLRGFATFEAKPTKAKPAKTGRNPRTGEPVAIDAKPAGKRVSIKAKFPAE